MMEPWGSVWMLIWIVVLLVMVWLIVRRPDESTPAQDAMAILGLRFARGEISEAEFERACNLLRADRMETMQ